MPSEDIYKGAGIYVSVWAAPSFISSKDVILYLFKKKHICSYKRYLKLIFSS